MPKRQRPRPPGFRVSLPAGYSTTPGKDGKTLDPSIMTCWGACRKCNRFGHFAKNCGAAESLNPGTTGGQSTGGSSAVLSPADLRAARLARFQSGAATSAPTAAVPAPAAPAHPHAVVADTPEPRPPATAPTPAIADLKVGMRLRFWFNDDRAWFAGAVKSISRFRGVCVAFDKVEGEDDITTYYKDKDLIAEVWELEISASAPPPPPTAPPPSQRVPEERVDTSGTLCLVCCDAEVSMVFHPCKHLCCCHSCVARLESQEGMQRCCPYCGQAYEQTSDVRLAGGH